MQRISTEFAGFVRDTGVRAFDRLTTRAKEVEAKLRPVLRAWSKLSDDQKTDLFDELIAAVAANDDDEETLRPAPKPKSKKKPPAAKKTKR